MELVHPTHQRVWGWPAVINFALGGMGSGLYLLGTVVAVFSGQKTGDSGQFFFKLIAPVLTCIGFIVLTVEAGRPGRSYLLLNHLRRSWISRETLAGAVFVLAALLDCLFPIAALWGLAAFAALGFLVSQGFVVYRARAVTAWNSSIVPFFLFTTGLVSGSGLLLIIGSLGLFPVGGLGIAISFFWIACNLGALVLFLDLSDDAAFKDAIGIFRKSHALLRYVGLGHLLPALLLLMVSIFQRADNVGPAIFDGGLAIAGLALMWAGASPKATLILKSGFLRTVAPERPGKGSLPTTEGMYDHIQN